MSTVEVVVQSQVQTAFVFQHLKDFLKVKTELSPEQTKTTM